MLKTLFSIVLFTLLFIWSGNELILASEGASFVIPSCAQPGLSIEQGNCRLLLELRSGEKKNNPAALFAHYSLIPMKRLHQIDVWLVASPGSPLDAVIPALAADAKVQWAQADGLLQAAEIVPNDEWYLAKQENLRAIGLPLAWRFTTGDISWPIAIIDTGIDLDHTDLAAKIWFNTGEIPNNLEDDDNNGYVDDVQGWDFVNEDKDPQDDSSHGSHVTGIAAAQSDNGLGIASVAWGAPVMALKALNSTGSGNASDTAEAILYAADNGVKIINLSLSADEEYESITQAVEYAQGLGCLVVAAVGNGSTSVGYPAATEGVLAVSATDNNDNHFQFSNIGPEVDVAAPGVNIFSASKSNSYYTASGTSASTPHVSGLAALIWSLRPEWDSLQVSEIITSTARDISPGGFDFYTGWGRIDANYAVNQALAHTYLPMVSGVR